MAKKNDGFFDDEDVDIEKEPTPETPPKAPKQETPPAEPTPPAKPEGGDPIDWKAKYEAAEAEKLDQRYLDELLLLDDSLEGDTLEAVEGGKRYRELRGKGLSARVAYAALQEEIAEASPEKQPSQGGKNHVSATTMRGTSPRSRMDKTTRSIVDDVLGDLSEEEKEDLYRRVSGK